MRKLSLILPSSESSLLPLSSYYRIVRAAGLELEVKKLLHLLELLADNRGFEE